MCVHACVPGEGRRGEPVPGTEEQMQGEGRDGVEEPEASLPLEQAAYAEWAVEARTPQALEFTGCVGPSHR